jgi:hypothetical protein
MFWLLYRFGEDAMGRVPEDAVRSLDAVVRDNRHQQRRGSETDVASNAIARKWARAGKKSVRLRDRMSTGRAGGSTPGCRIPTAA